MLECISLSRTSLNSCLIYHVRYPGRNVTRFIQKELNTLNKKFVTQYVNI